MASFQLTIGSLDITNYVAVDGYDWEQNDIDSANSGRDMNGNMRRKVIARKDKLAVTCRPLSEAKLSSLFSALKKKYVTVTYYLPETHGTRTATFYNSKRSVGVRQEIDGHVVYNGAGFDLIEV